MGLMVKVDDDFGQENEILVNDNLFEISFVGIKTGCTSKPGILPKIEVMSARCKHFLPPLYANVHQKHKTSLKF